MLGLLRSCLMVAGLTLGAFGQLPSPPTELIAQEGPAQTGATATSGGTTYTLAVTTSGAGGSVSGSNCSTNTYASGEPIGTCTANPSGGSVFVNWVGTGSATGCSTGTCAFNLSSNSTLVAYFTPGAGSAIINWTNVHQVIDGFGASDAFQGQGGGQGSTTSANQSLFFGTGSGQLGYSILRVCAPSGSSSPYCSFDCNSVGSACAGPYVSDMQSVIAQGGKVMASSWTPPAQYNTNNSTTCSGNSGLASGSYANYATWVTNFVKSLSAQSVSLYGFSVQNEPNDCGGNLAYLSAAGFDSFIGGYLGPTFASNSISTKIMLPDINYLDLSSWGGTCAGDSTCNNYVGIRNFQDYDAYLSGTNTVTPDPLPGGWSTTQNYWETEASCPTTTYSWPYDPSFCPSTGLTNDITHALDWAAVIDQRIAGDNANAWLYWWLYCDSCSDDEALSNGSGSVYIRGYVLAQYSKFVRPNYYRIDSTRQPQTGVSVSAYQNTPGGNLIIIATNYTGSAVLQTFSLTNAPTFTTLTPTITSASQSLTTLSNVSVSGQSFTYTLPAQSIITFTGISGGTTYTLSEATAGAGSGTLVCTPSGGGISAGTSYSCVVTPTGGSTLASVAGCGGSGTTTYIGSMPAANCTITATFNSGGGGSTYTAASASESDVNAVINGPTHTAINGDIIQIPCTGTQSVIWTSSLGINASITLTALGGATPNTLPSQFGSATNCLTIVDNVVGAWMFYLTPTYASTNNLTTLQNFNIDPMSSTTALSNPIATNGTATSAGFPQVRIDNIEFGKGTQWTESGNSSGAAYMIVQNDVIGVADHNTIAVGSAVSLTTTNFGSWLGVGLYGDNSWAQPDTMGTVMEWYEENNLFNSASYYQLSDGTESGPSFSQSGGGRIVNRFNQLTVNDSFGITGVHGLDSTGRPRSGRHTETYGNTMTCSNSGGNCQAAASFRGGTGVVFGNTITSSLLSGMFNSTHYNYALGNIPFGFCGGLNTASGGTASPIFTGDPWDTVDNAVYYSGTMTTSGSGVLTMTDSSQGFPNLNTGGYPYSVYDTTQGFVSQVSYNSATSITVIALINESVTGFNNGDHYEIIRATVCMDQGGRGKGIYISGDPATPVSPINEALDPIYEWDNTLIGGSIGANFTQNYSGGLLANRDYYTDNSLGSPHVQISSTSPFNGSSGVGFGTLANRPTTCTTGVGYFATDQGSWNISGNGFGQGELFKCTSTNTWTLGYTPYTYPHPLDH